MIALYAGLAFLGAMSFIAALGGSHDEHTTRKTVTALVFLLVGWAGIAVEFARAIF